MNILELSEQEILRRNSLEELRNMGINPYPADEYPVNAYAEEIKASFSDDAKTREALLGKLGVTVTALRPAGIAEIDGARIDVVTAGEFLEPQIAVEVTDVQGLYVLVRPTAK